MAFKSGSFTGSSAADPALHFKTLTKRSFPDVMPHQKEILETYSREYSGLADVALQLPTGSGKTLVGLLIADWKRVKDAERAVYLCPTKQLVKQTVEQAKQYYGLDVVDLSGKKSSFSAEDKAAYQTGNKIAVSTYSALFNSHSYFENPDLIIVDDAHAAENYIANMWSLEIEKDTPLHEALSEFFRAIIGEDAYKKVTGEWLGTTDSHWVEKIPAPALSKIESELVDIVDSFVGRDDPALYFPWSSIRDHLAACHVYLGIKGILIRPLLPPTNMHTPFANARQRIFMSATLGLGGDLERLTGRKSIARLTAPSGFQNSGVGRRFFLFPTLSLDFEESLDVIDELQEMSGRSVILTPSTPDAESHIERVQERLENFEVFTKQDIEQSKAPFVKSKKAVTVLANRYDGIDFPGDECRLLCVDGLPKAVNLQEKFVMSKMGAGAIYSDRIQTRVLQAMGRCTRALQDRSAVVVLGEELVDFLVDNRKWKYFPPELQAELKFAVMQSTEVSSKDFIENFSMFLANDSNWAAADNQIRSAVATFSQAEFPEMVELESTANLEIDYQNAVWSGDFSQALAKCREILSSLNHPNLRGYRALWHYLAGAASQRMSQSNDDAHLRGSIEHFSAAKSAAPIITWLNNLALPVKSTNSKDEADDDIETNHQVEAVERLFLSLGVTTNSKFEKRVSKILNGIEDGTLFESAQVEIGTLLGFNAGNDESDAAPDPWWFGHENGIVFESHADGKETTVLGATKSRQALTHAKWLEEYVESAKSKNITPILLTPCKVVARGAYPTLEDVLYWNLSEYKSWVKKAVGILRKLKGSFPGEGDLVWRAEAAQTLIKEGLTLNSIIQSLPFAQTEMAVETK